MDLAGKQLFKLFVLEQLPLSRDTIRELYGYSKVDWSRPKCAKHIRDAHGDWITTIAYAPDRSHFVTVSQDMSIKMWSPQGKELGHIQYAHDDWIEAVVYAPDGSHFVTASFNRSIKIWTGS